MQLSVCSGGLGRGAELRLELFKGLIGEEGGVEGGLGGGGVGLGGEGGSEGGGEEVVWVLF